MALRAHFPEAVHAGSELEVDEVERGAAAEDEDARQQ
jgi:hypothetical protein